MWRFVVADHDRARSGWTEQEQDEDSGPFWFGFALEAARAVAEGRPVGEVPTGWIERVAQVGIVTTSPGALASGKIQTFGQAVKDYITAVKESHPTLWGTGKVRLIEFVSEQVPDFTLGDLDLTKIDSILRLLANRPASDKTGEPISLTWARNTSKEFRCFLRWLHINKSYHWRRPDDYEVMPVKIKRSQEERAKITSLAVENLRSARWGGGGVEELATLWAVCPILGASHHGARSQLRLRYGGNGDPAARRGVLRLPAPPLFAGRIGLPEEAADWIRRLRGKERCV